MMFLMQASQPRLRCMAVTDDGWLDADVDKNRDHFVIQVSGTLYFAAARQLPERLAASIPADARRITIDLNHAHHSRVAAVQALQRFVQIGKARDVEVTICGHNESLARLAGVIGISLPWRKARVREQLVDPAAEPA